MSEIQDVHDKIELLEVKLAYQEDTIESLNQTIIEQQEKINYLEKTMGLVIDKMKTSSAAEQNNAEQDELPPHY